MFVPKPSTVASFISRSRCLRTPATASESCSTGPVCTRASWKRVRDTAICEPWSRCTSLFFRLFKDRRHAAYHHVFRLRADQDDAVLSPQLELHTVEMTKFPDLREGQSGEKWLYWLKHGHKMSEQEVAQLGVPEIIEAERKLAMISQDRQIRVDYERRRMAHHDAVSQGRESWVEEGKRQGQQEALVEALVSVLKARGFPISDELRARIDDETDLGRLKGWVTQAALASSVEAVLNS